MDNLIDIFYNKETETNIIPTFFSTASCSLWVRASGVSFVVPSLPCLGIVGMLLVLAVTAEVSTMSALSHYA